MISRLVIVLGLILCEAFFFPVFNQADNTQVQEAVLKFNKELSNLLSEEERNSFQKAIEVGDQTTVNFYSEAMKKRALQKKGGLKKYSLLVVNLFRAMDSIQLKKELKKSMGKHSLMAPLTKSEKFMNFSVAVVKGPNVLERIIELVDNRKKFFYFFIISFSLFLFKQFIYRDIKKYKKKPGLFLRLLFLIFQLSLVMFFFYEEFFPIIKLVFTYFL